MRTNILIKKILFCSILAMLFLPMAQTQFGLIEILPLNGAVEDTRDTSFSLKSYMNEDYQKKKEKYINDQFGFRNWLVRLKNQFAFEVYRTAAANGVVVGKNDYLYELGYIESYTGENFIGEKKIDDNIIKLKQISDTLKAINIDLIIVLAAGKASFFPEFIPDRYATETAQTNYKYYAAQIKNSGLHSIDFNKYFIDNRHTSEYPLYPKTGIHWSTYGTALAADSLSTYIKRLKNIDAPDMFWNNVVMRDSLSAGDRDIELGMNLLFDIPDIPMGYPELQFDEIGKTKAKTMVVADSYYWGIYGSGIASRLFERPEFWYYFKEAYIAGEPTQNVDEMDVQKEIERQDVVVLMATEATLPEFPWGFIEKVHDIYFGTEAQKKKNESVKQ